MVVDISERLRVDPALPDTLAQQIREQLTWLIAEEALRPGDELPSVRTLAGVLGVNYHTVRAAYGRLEQDGLVASRRGRRCRVVRFDPRRLLPVESAALTHLVGIVLPSLANPFYAELVEGAQEAARPSGALLVVCSTHDDQALALRSVALLAARGVDGVVVVSHDIASLLAGPEEDPAWPASLPVVSVDRPGARGHSVEADLEDAGYRAARHLVEHGHRAIGLISFARLPATGEPPSNVIPLEAGVSRALAAAGLSVDPAYVARVEAWDEAAGEAAARRLLESDRRPTALVAISDLLAMGAIRALRRAGVAVPAEMAVIGVDDIPSAAVVDPPLTTVALPARAMGAESVAVLEAVRAGRGARPRRVVLDVRIVIRESCGPHAS